jgi:uncharacterized protein YwgA
MGSGMRPEIRLATIAELARRGEGRFGRTAIMKLCYFLQTLAEVPLQYSFRLYTYGPYDSQVLEDLKIAESIGAVQSKSFEWPGGYGVAIAHGDKSDALVKRAGPEFGKIKTHIEKITREFGDRNASDLELLSTIIYVDRSYRASGKSLSISELISHVHDVKPHHDNNKIKSEVETLLKKHLLSSPRLAA